MCVWAVAGAALTVAGCGGDPPADEGDATTSQVVTTGAATPTPGASGGMPTGDDADVSVDSTSGSSGAGSALSSSSSDDDGTSTGENGSTDTGQTTGEALDCVNIPPLAVEYELVTGHVDSEDFVFDDAGNMVQIVFGDLLHSTYGMPPTLVFPGVGQSFSYGISILSTGEVAFAAATYVGLVGPGGSSDVLASGLSFANGVIIDQSDTIYTSEISAGRVLRIDPRTLAVEEVVSGIPGANGIAFDQYFTKLYVSTLYGFIHEVDIATSAVEVVARDVGNPHGLVLDQCDNIYFTDPTALHRIRDGVIELMVDFAVDPGPANSAVVSNMHFGSGVGGWEETSIYLMDRNNGNVLVFDIGIPGAPLPHL